MRRSYVFLAIAALVSSAGPVAAQAEVLQAIPDDAIAFALVNRVGQTNDKVTALAKRLKMPLPGNPLEKIKDHFGVDFGADKGLAQKGSAAIAAFAGKGDDDPPRAVLFLPVTDYKAFLDRLQPGETKDGITAITLKGGVEMLAGKRGDFAVVAGPMERDLVERALKSTKGLASWAEPLSGWLAENDVAGVLTGRGIKLVGTHARRGIDEAKQNLAILPPEAQFVVKIFDGVESCFKSAESDVTHAGLAARVDPAGNLHVTVRALFLKDSGFAKAGASVKALPGGPLAGLPSGPFVIAMGGVTPENAMQSLLNMNMEIMKASGQNISEEALKKLEKAYARTMKGMSGMGFVWQVGKENQPLFANLAATLHTTDAAAYLADYEKSLAAMNELSKELNLPILPTYEVKKVKVNGKHALEASMDFAGALGGIPDEMQKIVKSMFGPDGKMTIAIAARDDQTIVMRYTGADGLKDLLSGQDKGLSNDAGVAQVTKALPAGAQWSLLVSPHGTTEIADRLVKASPLPIQVPQFPATPPVAAAVRVSAQGVEMHAVIPAGVIDNVSGFVEQLKKLIPGGV